MQTRVAGWVPHGVLVTDEEWLRRHRTLLVLLGAQIPILFAFGLVRGFTAAHLALELAVPVAAVAAALSPRLSQRVRATIVTAGLVFLSAALVHLSGGYIEAHFHFFIMLGFIALYQDWIPFGWAIGFTLLSHTYMSLVDPDSMFNHPAAQDNPVQWAGIHAAAVAFAAAGQLAAWKAAERGAEEKSSIREALMQERRDAIARMYVDLSRRNGSLVEQQLDVIDDLEGTVDDPDVLGRLFELDHLTTRMRRNGESLLVVAGADPLVTRRAPLPLVDVARGAVSEVDQYARVDVDVEDDVHVHGPAVRDLAHLLAELIENGTSYSPPGSRVVVDARVDTQRDEERSVVVRIEDRGIGMDDEALARANDVITDPGELRADASRHLGHQVVARLAAKHGVRVLLRRTEGGGITAVVTLPNALVRLPGEPVPVDRPSAPAPDARDEPVGATDEVSEVADELSETPEAVEPTPSAAPASDAVVPDPPSAPPLHPPLHTPPAPPAPTPAAVPAGADLDTSPLPPPPWELPERTPVGAGSNAPRGASLAFTSGPGPERSTRTRPGLPSRTRRQGAPTATVETLPAREQLPVREVLPAPETLPARQPASHATATAEARFVQPPAADANDVLPSRDGAPGLPTRRPGASRAEARRTGLFGEPAPQERAASTTSDSGFEPDEQGLSSRAALTALSQYQQSQRAVRGDDNGPE